MLKHAFARRLRRDQTDFERKLWLALRDRRLSGFKFRRQQPIGPYVVDFLCCDAKLVIELDGSQHDLPENLEADRIRTSFLEGNGYRVLRFRNIALIENMDGVLEAIFLAVREC
jgi:very-short-patch-repair endonuclease